MEIANAVMRLLIVLLTCLIQAYTSIPAKETILRPTDHKAMPIDVIPQVSPCGLSVNAFVSDTPTSSGLVLAEVTISSFIGKESQFNVFVDGVISPSSPYTYDPCGHTEIVIALPGKNKIHQVFVHDVNDASCTAIVPVETPDTQVVQNTMPYTIGERLIVSPNPVPAGQESFAILDVLPDDYYSTGHVSIYSIDEQWIASESIVCDEDMSVEFPPGLRAGVYIVELRTIQHYYTGKIIIQ